MKKSIILSLILSLAIVGCGNNEEVKEPTVVTDYEITEVDSTESSEEINSENSGEEEVTDVNETTNISEIETLTKVVKPYPRKTLEDLTDNEVLSVVIKAINREDKTITVDIYGFDIYNFELIRNLQVDEMIMLRDEITKVENIEFENDLIKINGGMEENGYTLLKNNGECYEVHKDGIQEYYLFGEDVVLNISDDFEFVNLMEFDNEQIGKLEDLEKQMVRSFVHNTALSLEENEVVSVKMINTN